jgi:hypothetical protein
MRRRIVCDKGEPACGKCIKKGIECAGVNRIRFTDSVARRGKLKDCKIPDISSNGAVILPSSVTFTEVSWPTEKKRVQKRARGGRKRSTSQDSARTCGTKDAISTTDLTVLRENSYPSGGSTPSLSWSTPATSDADVEEISRTSLHRTFPPPPLQPWLPPIDPNTRVLFSYFSRSIAPVMVVLDTASNGYRHLILPMALENPTLRRAVGVVAAQHLRHSSAAEAGRSAIISQLREDAMSGVPERIFNKYTWATLIVLLVGETVTGSVDYKYLVQMLICLVLSGPVCGLSGEGVRFLQTQTNMYVPNLTYTPTTPLHSRWLTPHRFELLSLPLTSEHTGLCGIQASPASWEQWLICESFPLDSPSFHIIDAIRMCFETASRIYTRRATTCDPDLASPDLPELLARLAAISPNMLGAHTLVWPCFVAGAETQNETDRVFVKEYLLAIYKRTGFKNVPAAVESLEKLVRGVGRRRWTGCLGEFSEVLIM